MEPITYYKSQSEKHKHTLRQYQKQRNFITITKILIFAIIVWQIYIAINDGTPYFLYSLLVAIIAFIAMTRIDSKVVNHIRVTEALIRINEEENAYLQGDLSPFPAGYCGAYVYEDLLPTIAGVSGAFFEKVGEEYVSKEGYASLLTDCFHIDRRPFAIDGMDGLDEVRVTLGEDGGIGKIVLSYGLLDGIMGTYVSGEATITFSGVGSTTLEGLIG